MRILITGASGFVGSHLCRYLAGQPGLELHLLARSPSTPALDLSASSNDQLHIADLLDPPALRQVLWLIQPQHIYHLAAFANPGQSFLEARQAWDANLTATLNLYDACLSELKTLPRILLVSTGAVYGEAPSGEPLTESSPMFPNNPYAASKAAADLASFQYFKTHGLPIIRARPFNQTGPGQSTQFALSRFAHQLVQMERGGLPPTLHVGNLESERDFTDVRDMIRAYHLLMEKGAPGEAYILASGVVHPMKWFLKKMLQLTPTRVDIVQDASLVRPVETRKLRIDCTKLQRTTGWEPRVPLEQTLGDLLQFHRNSPPPPAAA